MSGKTRPNIELPFVEPWFATYHNLASPGVIAKNNPSADNWYFNHSIQIWCNPENLHKGSDGKISIYMGRSDDMPFLERIYFNTRFLRNCAMEVIQSMLEQQFYVVFWGVDDYYVEGKSGYQKHHFNHDGLIRGVDNETKEYMMCAYDEQQTYRSFRTSQIGFMKGMMSGLDTIGYGWLIAVRCRPAAAIDLDVPHIKQELHNYLHSAPGPEEKYVYGLDGIPHIIGYLGRLKDGEIPFEGNDPRVFRLIWEHKRCMAARIIAVEKHCGLSHELSNAYAPLMDLANNIRFVHMKYSMTGNNRLLDKIKEQLLELTKKESELLLALHDKI